MKKKKKMKHVISTIIMLLSIPLVCIFAYRFNNASAQQNKIHALTKYNNYIYSNNASFSKAESIQKDISKYSDKINDSLINDKWAVIIISGNENIPQTVTQYIPAGDGYSLTGYTTIMDRTVIVKDSPVVQHTVAHEIGHVMSYEYGYLSFSFKFTSLFEKYAASYEADDYFKNNRDEFFAETFADYLTNPEKLKKEAPEIFEFFEEMLKEETVSTNKFKTVYLSPVAVFRMLVAQIDKINQVRI